MGLSFPNPLGLAAGFDKHGEMLEAMEAAGFGFVEVGTVTPRPEPGHNLGVETLVANLSRSGNGPRRPRTIVLGISIGKNLETPCAQAVEDYLTCLRRVWEHADYVTVNLSAPATRYLQGTEHEDALRALLARLKDEQAILTVCSGRRVPLAVKVGLNPSATEVPGIVEHVKRLELDAIIAAIGPGDWGTEPGPAADAATREHAARSVRALTSYLEGAVPVISVGGIASPQDAWERLDAGASLVQLYRGLINNGPRLIRRITEFLERAARPPAVGAWSCEDVNGEREP